MPEINDKRVIKTKRAIRDAFLDLVEECGFEKVTVQMIADRAFIGKTTCSCTSSSSVTVHQFTGRSEE